MGAEQKHHHYQQSSLIPGLPDDVAQDCLVRVPYHFHSGPRRVCWRWRNLVTDPSFYQQRRKAGTGEALLCLVQALVPASEVVEENRPDDHDGDGGCGADKGSQKQNCTPAPAVQASGKLVLVGGWDAATLDSVPDVHVVDLVTGRRRRGEPMSAARSFFACAAVGWLVYVAGGHDNQKNTLRSAEVYDPAADE